MTCKDCKFFVQGEGRSGGCSKKNNMPRIEADTFKENPMVHLFRSLYFKEQTLVRGGLKGRTLNELY